MKKGLKIFLIIFGILMFGNLVFLDWRLFWSEDEKWEVRTTGETKEEEKVATDSCGLVCQEMIEEKIQEELARLPSPAGQSPVPVVSLPASGKPKTVYVPLITSGTVASASWTDVVPSEFYFDLVDYPNVKEVRFEAYLLSSNNDMVYGRIYDQTNKRGVDFSDIQTNSSTFTREESSKITIWRGNNKYTVQLRSVNATLVQIKDAKLKVIY